MRSQWGGALSFRLFEFIEGVVASAIQKSLIQNTRPMGHSRYADLDESDLFVPELLNIQYIKRTG